MKKVRAVLVDGVGHTQELTVSPSAPRVLVPKPMKWNLAALAKLQPNDSRWPATYGAITFDYCGSLDDGRRVYGYRFDEGPPYQIWEHRQIWTREAENKDPSFRTFLDRVIDEALQQLGHQIVRLYDVTENTDAYRRERTLQGVGRNMSPPR